MLVDFAIEESATFVTLLSQFFTLLEILEAEIVHLKDSSDRPQLSALPVLFSSLESYLALSKL